MTAEPADEICAPVQPPAWPVERWPPQTGKPLPSPEDPFYVPSAGWEDTASGTLLRHRKVRIALFGLLPVRLNAWQLLYRSTDLHGEPETTVTTVLVPRDATETSPLLAQQAPIDAVTSRRFPSYYLLPRTFGMVQTQNETMLIVAALAKGWIVTMSDHEGPHGLFMVARQPGYHVLDGVRATLAFTGQEGVPALPIDAPVGLWGYSGGGTASAWAAELADEYAPELNIVGAMLGAPAARPGALVEHHSRRFASGIIPTVFASLMRGYPEVREFVERHVTPHGRQILEKSAHISLVEAAVRWPFKNLDALVDRPIAELMMEPEITSVTTDMNLGQRAPKFPVYLYHGVFDELLPITASDQLVRDYLGGGTHVTYRRDLASEHISLAVTGGPDALAWLEDRTNGVPLPSGPDKKTVLSTSLTPRALAGLLRWQWGIAKLLLGRL